MARRKRLVPIIPFLRHKPYGIDTIINEQQRRWRLNSRLWTILVEGRKPVDSDDEEDDEPDIIIDDNDA